MAVSVVTAVAVAALAKAVATVAVTAIVTEVATVLAMAAIRDPAAVWAMAADPVPWDGCGYLRFRHTSWLLMDDTPDDSHSIDMPRPSQSSIVLNSNHVRCSSRIRILSKNSDTTVLDSATGAWRRRNDQRLVVQAEVAAALAKVVEWTAAAAAWVTCF